MFKRTIPADRPEPSPFERPPGQPYAGLARGSNWSRCVAHAPARWYSRGMKRMGLPGPVPGHNWIDSAEAARILAIKPECVCVYVKRKCFPVYHLGDIQVFDDVEVRKYAERRGTIKPTKPSTSRPTKRR